MNSFSVHHRVGSGPPLGLAANYRIESGRSQELPRSTSNPTALPSALLQRSQYKGADRQMTPELGVIGASRPSRPETDSAVIAAQPIRRTQSTGRILFMDDDEHIRTFTGAMLDSLGFSCDLVRTGEEAVQLYTRYLGLGQPYDVAVMDLTIIGGMGGEEAFGFLRMIDPAVRAIIASGCDDEDKVDQLMEKGVLGYLAKPYRIAQLEQMIKAVLAV